LEDEKLVFLDGGCIARKKRQQTRGVYKVSVLCKQCNRNTMSRSIMNSNGLPESRMLQMHARGVQKLINYGQIILRTIYLVRSNQEVRGVARPATAAGTNNLQMAVVCTNKKHKTKTIDQILISSISCLNFITVNSSKSIVIARSAFWTSANGNAWLTVIDCGIGYAATWQSAGNSEQNFI
jgi:hypothetical protein